MQVDRTELQRHLSGIDYPAAKDEIIATAESKGAPQELLETLQAGLRS